jgi:hypothetical protein
LRGLGGEDLRPRPILDKAKTCQLVVRVCRRVFSTQAPIPSALHIEALDGGFKIVDANGQALAYVYGHADSRDAGITKALTLDEARRVASNIAKLPDLLGKGG